MPVGLLAGLDERAAREQVSRSEVIRQAFRAHLQADAEDVARSYRDGYGRFPLGTEDEWGDLESFQDELTTARPLERQVW
ncbi:MAG: ribbon-helix-helix domain-containing protein [Egibacteraceae bacterium]